jgi:hypothetical protein
MTGKRPSVSGRKTSARKIKPSSIVIGTFQSIRMPSRLSLRGLKLLRSPAAAAMWASPSRDDMPNSPRTAAFGLLQINPRIRCLGRGESLQTTQRSAQRRVASRRALTVTPLWRAACPA